MKNTGKKFKIDTFIVSVIGNTVGDQWWYDENNDKWVNISKELLPHTDIHAYTTYTVKSLIRKILKWGLPKGVTIVVNTLYRGECIKLITK